MTFSPSKISDITEMTDKEREEQYIDNILPMCLVAEAIKAYAREKMHALYKQRKSWQAAVKKNIEEIEATRTAGKVHKLDAERPRQFALDMTGLKSVNEELMLGYLRGDMKQRIVMLAVRRLLEHFYHGWAKA